MTLKAHKSGSSLLGIFSPVLSSYRKFAKPSLSVGGVSNISINKTESEFQCWPRVCVSSRSYLEATKSFADAIWYVFENGEKNRKSKSQRTTTTHRLLGPRSATAYSRFKFVFCVRLQSRLPMSRKVKVKNTSLIVIVYGDVWVDGMLGQKSQREILKSNAWVRK